MGAPAGMQRRQDEAPETPDSGETRPADPINAAPVNERADDVDVALAATAFGNGAELDISKHHETDRPAEVTGQGQKSQPASQPRATATGSPRKRAKRAPAQAMAHNSKVEHENRRAHTATVDNPISLDELAALDADNKRLKRLLAEQLRAHNLWLKKMLERFDAE